MSAPWFMPEGLSRVMLLDHKRDGLSDIAVATLYGTEPGKIKLLRSQLGVPALACDLKLEIEKSKVRDKRKAEPAGKPWHSVSGGSSAPEGGEGLRTTDHAEAYFRSFFAKHPNFGHDDVKVKPMRRMTASVCTIVGCGGTSLSDIG